jgi:hypothetical protein
MKFWKKKDTNAKSTNPFEEQEEKPCKQPEEDSYSFSTEYSQTPTASAPFRSRYSKPQPTSSARERNYTQDRQDLFRGQTDLANRYDSNGQEDVYSQSKFAEGDEDQEVAQVRQKIRNVKQDTLASTRNALQKINETEVSATNTMNMLGTQSSKSLVLE